MSAQQLDRTVPFPADRVFALLTDISAYPRVLRLVRSAELLDRTRSNLPGTESVSFALKVGYGLISSRFVGRALINGAEHTAIIAQQSGPFETFLAKVQLQAVDADRTRIFIVSEWALASTGVGGLVAGLIEGQGNVVMRKLVAAFVKHLERETAEPAVA